MADYAPNFTFRHKLTYSFEGDQHECNTRWPSAGTLISNLAAANAFWLAVLTATAALRHTSFALVSAEYALADSNVFLPTELPDSPDPGTRVAASGSSSRIMHSIWPGRTLGGSKTRFMLFGLLWAVADSTEAVDFYVTPAENTVVEDVAIAIEVGSMVGPDDENIILVRRRVAYKQNDAWVNKRRSAT